MVAHNFVLTRGSGEIKLIDFDGIGTENRFVTPEYQPYEHFEVGVYRKKNFAKFFKIDRSEELKVGETRKNMNASYIFGIIATLILSLFFFLTHSLFSGLLQ